MFCASKSGPKTVTIRHAIVTQRVAVCQETRKVFREISGFDLTSRFGCVYTVQTACRLCALQIRLVMSGKPIATSYRVHRIDSLMVRVAYLT